MSSSGTRTEEPKLRRVSKREPRSERGCRSDNLLLRVCEYNDEETRQTSDELREKRMCR
jgi:hypothetical protein